MKKRFIKPKKLLVFAILLMCYSAYSSPTLIPKTISSSKAFDTNDLLIVVALILLVPIYLLSRTLLFAVKLFIEKEQSKKSKNITNTLLVLFALFTAHAATAQDVTSTALAKSESLLSTANILLAVVVVEVIVIILLGTFTLAFLKGANHIAVEKVVVKKQTSSFINWWKKNE
jgi:hypothetical protein